MIIYKIIYSLIRNIHTNSIIDIAGTPAQSLHYNTTEKPLQHNSRVSTPTLRRGLHHTAFTQDTKKTIYND